MLKFAYMNFLYHSKTQKAIKIIWGIIVFFVIISMVLFFMPTSFFR